MILVFIIIAVMAVSCGFYQAFSAEYRRVQAEREQKAAIQRQAQQKARAAAIKQSNRLKSAELTYSQLINRWYQLDTRYHDLTLICSATKLTDKKVVINQYTYATETVTDVKAIKQRIALDKQFETIQQQRTNIINQLYKIYDLLSVDKQNTIDSMYNDYINELN